MVTGFLIEPNTHLKVIMVPRHFLYEIFTGPLINTVKKIITMDLSTSILSVRKQGNFIKCTKRFIKCNNNINVI